MEQTWGFPRMAFAACSLFQESPQKVQRILEVWKPFLKTSITAINYAGLSKRGYAVSGITLESAMKPESIDDFCEMATRK